MPTDRPSENRDFFSRWSRVSLRAQGVGVLVFPVAVLFAALFTIYWSDSDVRSADAVIARAYQTRAEIMQLHSSLLEAETAEAGYRATGQDRFRAAAEIAQSSVRASLARLPSMSGDTPVAIAAVARIGQLAPAELDLLAQTRAAPPSPAPPEAGRETAVMGELQAQLALLGSEQDHLFTKARLDRDLARQKLFRTVMVFGTLGPLGALFIHLLVAGRLVRRIQRVEENARRLAHGLPLEPFPAGTDEIAALARQIEDAAYLLRDREGELRGSERRYRDLFNQAPIPYEETDCQGVVTRFNQAVCTLLKCTPDQVLGRHAWDFVAPDQQHEFRAAMLERIASARETGPFECDYMLDDGSRIAVEIRENLVHNDQGHVTGVCRSLLDVTERNLAAITARKVEQYAMELRIKNEQLGRALDTARSATAAKSRFLASISHELRTPLNGIIGFSEMMYDGRLGPLTEEQRDVVADILASGRHLLQLINDILDLSKVEAGRMEFRPEPCELGTLVSEVRDIIRPLAEKKNIQLSTDLPSGLTVIIDPGRFKQVLYNYLSNAVKFTGRDGSVSIRLALEGDHSFRLDVTDTGSGIPPDEISRLFQEFEQLPNSRKAEQGTGLGLALTRHIVEAQGGTVSVRSELGHGSVFSAVLPISVAAKNGSATE
ncbi:MAG: ATP-binding protein [Candidatus Sulfopaludibacter sp.]|nr:ATP-binding protein [Candidatus Sulfopaludibacter sp.]